MLWVIKIVLIENKFTVSNIISMFACIIFEKFGYGLILVLFCKCRDISQPTSSPVGGNLDCVRYRSGTRYVNGRQEPIYTTKCTVSSTSNGCARGDTAAIVCGESAHIAKLSVGFYYRRKLVHCQIIYLCSPHLYDS